MSSKDRLEKTLSIERSGLYTYLNIFRSYIELFKIRQTLASVFIGVMTYLKYINLTPDLYSLILFSSALFLVTAGATGVNMFLDADIDSIMIRTRNRPIPSGRIERYRAFVISLVIMILGLYISYVLNIYVFISAFLGVLIFDILYTLILKRRTPWSVVICSSAGAMPVIAGASLSGRIDIEVLYLSVMISLWSLIHIWTTSIRWADDYRNAHIPMLPAVYGAEKSIETIFVAVSILYIFNILMYIKGFLSVMTLIFSSLILLIMIILGIKSLVSRKYEKYSYLMFKINTLYLIIFFIFYLLNL